MIKQFQIEKNIQTEKTLKRLKLNLNFAAENRKLKNANKKLENTILLSSKNRLLKSLIFYGQNEVGKSQIYQDLKNFRDFISNGTLKTDFFNASLRFFIKIDNELLESEINIHFQNGKIQKEELAAEEFEELAQAMSRCYHESRDFRGFCKKSGSLYVFPEGEGGKHSPQLKKVLDGCPEVDHVVTTVRKVFDSSKTAIA